MLSAIQGMPRKHKLFNVRTQSFRPEIRENKKPSPMPRCHIIVRAAYIMHPIKLKQFNQKLYMLHLNNVPSKLASSMHTQPLGKANFRAPPECQ